MQIAPSSSHSALLSTSELAKFLGVPVTTVYSWRTHGTGPPGYRVGRHTRYRPGEVLGWLEQRRLAEKQTAA
jgi:excisionase family DNA binding protein